MSTVLYKTSYNIKQLLLDFMTIAGKIKFHLLLLLWLIVFVSLILLNSLWQQLRILVLILGYNFLKIILSHYLITKTVELYQAKNSMKQYWCPNSKKFHTLYASFVAKWLRLLLYSQPNILFLNICLKFQLNLFHRSFSFNSLIPLWLLSYVWTILFLIF